MPVGELQNLVVTLIGQALNADVKHEVAFEWLRNTHTVGDCGRHFATIDRIFSGLKGNPSAAATKRSGPILCDAYFAGDLNFILEFDEFQHFSSARLKTLDSYPRSVLIGFDIAYYQLLCKQHSAKADYYRRAKTTKDFNFIGGRTAQRAYFDTMKDLLPELHGKRPTVRVSEFELPSPIDGSQTCLAQLREIVNAKRKMGGHPL
jgi:hypothetical protein